MLAKQDSTKNIEVVQLEAFKDWMINLIEMSISRYVELLTAIIECHKFANNSSIVFFCSSVFYFLLFQCIRSTADSSLMSLSWNYFLPSLLHIRLKKHTDTKDDEVLSMNLNLFFLQIPHAQVSCCKDRQKATFFSSHLQRKTEISKRIFFYFSSPELIFNSVDDLHSFRAEADKRIARKKGGEKGECAECFKVISRFLVYSKDLRNCVNLLILVILCLFWN